MSDTEQPINNLTRRGARQRQQLRRAGKYLHLILLAALLALACAGAGCRGRGEKKGVRPRSLRDVPAQRLAFSFEADTDAPPGAAAAPADAGAKLPSVQSDFEMHRPEDALLRTIISPDQQRVLALYATGADEGGEFHLDLYDAGGTFIRHITTEGMSGAAMSGVAWSPDSSLIAFIAFKSLAPEPTPTPPAAPAPDIVPDVALPTPTPSSAPVAPTVPIFKTEQIYLCTRDGYDLKPLTMREGLIYFYLAWAPDSHGLVALACTENEFYARPDELLTAGRPRLVALNGSERLLDDELTDVLPVWSPDASKVATAFNTEVRIYDADATTPTQAGIALKDQLLAASRAYDQKRAQETKTVAENRTGDDAAPPPTEETPVSFNPIVRLEWPQPDTLYLQTGYVRDYKNDLRRTWMRWHKMRLSAQAALLG